MSRPVLFRPQSTSYVLSSIRYVPGYPGKSPQNRQRDVSKLATLCGRTFQS